jgi:hypothetical protein
MRSTAYLRAQFYISGVLFWAMAAINFVSVLGFDLSVLLPYPAGHWETYSPESLVILPTLGTILLLLMSLIAGGRLKISVPSYGHWNFGVNGFVGIVVVYAVATFAYTAIRVPSPPTVDHGQLAIISNGVRTILSPGEYHRDVATVMALASAWLMMPLAFLNVCYRDWLRELGSLRNLSS